MPVLSRFVDSEFISPAVTPGPFVPPTISCNISRTAFVCEEAMTTKKLIPITLAATLALGGFIGFANQATGQPPQMFQGRLLQRAKEKLALTDDQKSQIKGVVKADKDAITSLMTRMREARTELREAIRSADATEASVRAAAAKVAAVEADVAVQRMKMHAKINPILTDEQRGKIAQFQAYMETVRDNIVDRIEERLAE